MFATTLKSVQTARIFTRSFSKSAPNKDFVKDLYLKELKNFKRDPKAVKNEVPAKSFVEPKRAETLKMDLDSKAAIQTYAQDGIVN
ncbi:hypothetical protein BB559_003705 [Furculomyces boomerangus]|uniref:Uncharacterized protein n=2 Tax=Harpellales TaxID=61421 RepID=A0A2T9YJF9_9FUNG|nr:hypothetical protein BB559_003705 [Furculomyces boomerangus]PWA01943.1 hypothetical protein BB558_001931 [Smittium angustum]